MSYRYPFTPFPTGWYRIDIGSGEILAFGHELKLETQHDGSMNLYDTSHRFRSYPVLRKNGDIYAFYDEKEQAPYYEIPDVPELNHPHWQRPFHLSWKHTRVHIQEVAENALDLSHFRTVHTYKDIPTLSRFHTFGHQFNVVMHSRRKVLGMLTETTMDITYHGMGITVADVSATHGINLKVLLTTTPVDQEHVDINMSIAIKKSANPLKNLLLRCILPSDIKTEFGRDIPVWEAKIYRDKPLVCRAEANIIRIRKWARQFYTGYSAT